MRSKSNLLSIFKCADKNQRNIPLMKSRSQYLTGGKMIYYLKLLLLHLRHCLVKDDLCNQNVVYLTLKRYPEKQVIRST